MKLYLVTLVNFHSFYVVAPDETTAYKKVREAIDKLDWFVESKRKLHSIEVIASESLEGTIDNIFEKEN